MIDNPFRILDAEVVGIDTETTGLHPPKDRAFGVSLWSKHGGGYLTSAGTSSASGMPSVASEDYSSRITHRLTSGRCTRRGLNWIRKDSTTPLSALR